MVCICCRVNEDAASDKQGRYVDVVQQAGRGYLHKNKRCQVLGNAV